MHPEDAPLHVLPNGPVGIDAIAAYVPRLYVDLTKEWAAARAPALTGGSVEALVGKVQSGVGVRRMAIADAHEDTATLAAMAAKRVLDMAGVDPRDVDFLAVGTETTVDQSKSIAAYVLGMLERHYGVRLDDVGAPQLQFACIGATYALEAAVDRLRAGSNVRPYALVVASDIAKYPLGSPGEYTQGAGAVALLVSKNPRLLALEPGLTATVTRDERDFFRPNWTRDAVVDGKYSIDVYLDCMEAAFERFAARAERARGIRPESLYAAVDHFLFHVPFPRMAEYASLRIFGRLFRDDPALRARLDAEVTARPGDASRASLKDFERALAKTSLFEEAFARKVAASLALAREVGNVYSGSLYLALVSLLERARDTDLTGHRIVLGSYGSGASAKVLSGVVAEGYRRVTGGLRLHDELRDVADGGTRVALSVAEYERLHRLTDVEPDLPEALAAKIDAGAPLAAGEVETLRAVLASGATRIRPRGPSVVAPAGAFALTRLGDARGPERTDVGYRYYAWVDG